MCMEGGWLGIHTGMVGCILKINDSNNFYNTYKNNSRTNNITMQASDEGTCRRGTPIPIIEWGGAEILSRY